MGFEITLRDRTTLAVDDADAFAHEKSMTTFYRTSNARQSIDCWAVPLASIRTDEILMVQRRPLDIVDGIDGIAAVHQLASA